MDMLLEMVGLEAVQRRPVGEYSKGMQRRIGLAQALINDPDLLILDEPTTGLDPLGTRQVKDLILMLRERGKTVLLCSHLLADVEDVCDRVAVLYGGKVRAAGTVKDLLTISDSLVLETDPLEPATVERVRELLAHERKTLRKAEAPRKKLEELFLEIVRRAQAEGAATSGARADGRLPEFLTQGVATAEPAGRAVIEQLVQGEKPPAPPPPAAAPQPAPAPGPDRAAIAGLVQPAPAPEKPEAPRAAPPVDRDVIEKLLNKDEKK